MNRRRFLSLLALGAPATVVAEKVGLIEKVRTYFFAPPGGWEVVPVAHLSLAQRIALGRSSGVVLYGGARGGGKQLGFIAANADRLSAGEVVLFYRADGHPCGNLVIESIRGNIVIVRNALPVKLTARIYS
jgi:hypothetical protein